MQGFTSGIGAETGDESGVGSGPTARNSLIQSLAAGVFGIIGAKNCFARRGETIDRGDEVEIAASENDNIVCVRTVGLVSSEPCRMETNTGPSERDNCTKAISS